MQPGSPKITACCLTIVISWFITLPTFSVKKSTEKASVQLKAFVPKIAGVHSSLEISVMMTCEKSLQLGFLPSFQFLVFSLWYSSQVAFPRILL